MSILTSHAIKIARRPGRSVQDNSLSTPVLGFQVVYDEPGAESPEKAIYLFIKPYYPNPK